jgi:hypothetical protein
MNNTFNLSRFGRLFIKHTAEHYKSYLMSLIVLAGVIFLGGSFLVYIIPGPIDTGVQSTAFVGILLLAGTIFTSTIFADYGDKNKAMAALILPASTLEKYLVAWLYSFAIFLVVYIGTFFLLVSLLLHMKHYPGQTVEVFSLADNHIGLPMFLLFALLQSVAFYGSIFFKKLHFIKGAFAFFISLAILIIVNKVFQSILIGRDVLPSPPFSNMRIMENERQVLVSLSDQQAPYILLLCFILALSFWIAAYFRLKEKQV